MEEKLNSEIEELFESIAGKIKDKKLVESIRELGRLRYQQGVTFPPLGIYERLKSVVVQVDPNTPTLVLLDKNALNEEDIAYLSNKATGWPENSIFVLLNGDPESIATIKPLMTGQEWYEKFEKELYLATMPQERASDRYDDILDAARKAAGIA